MEYMATEARAHMKEIASHHRMCISVMHAESTNLDCLRISFFCLPDEYLGQTEQRVSQMWGWWGSQDPFSNISWKGKTLYEGRPTPFSTEKPHPQARLKHHYPHALTRTGMWQHSSPKQLNAKSMMQSEQIRQTKDAASAGQG